MDAHEALVAALRAAWQHGWDAGDEHVMPPDDALVALVPEEARLLLIGRSCPLCGATHDLGSMCAACSKRIEGQYEQGRAEGRREMAEEAARVAEKEARLSDPRHTDRERGWNAASNYIGGQIRALAARDVAGSPGHAHDYAGGSVSEVVRSKSPSEANAGEPAATLGGAEGVEASSPVSSRASVPTEAGAPDLSPCPFDSGEGIMTRELRAGYDDEPDDPDAYAYAVRCRTCATEGPWHKGEASAVRAWNRREGVAMAELRAAWAVLNYCIVQVKDGGALAAQWMAEAWMNMDDAQLAAIVRRKEE